MFLCRRLCGAQTPDCVLNIHTWFCTCLDAKQHQTCAHLLAAQQHPEFGAACNLAAYDPSTSGDAHDVIGIQRSPPLSMALDVEEPVNEFGGEADIQALQAAAQNIRNASRTRMDSGLSDVVKAFKRHAAAISTFAAYAELVSDECLQQGMPKVEEVSEWCQQHLPRFADAGPQSQQGWSRQDSDRTLKPLFNRKRARATRTSQSTGVDDAGVAIDEDHAVSPSAHADSPLLPSFETLCANSPTASDTQQHRHSASFAPVRSSRPVLNERGVGNLVRQSQRTYARRPARCTMNT